MVWGWGRVVGARASDTVTAFWLPEGMNDEETMEQLRAVYGVVLAGGQGELAGQILRIGHMGHVTEAEIDEALAAVKQVLGARAAAAR
jgi:aspartate aminotransferase-like enzyme